MTYSKENELSIADFASKFINNTNKHVFLTGKAGSGKTTFLRELIKSTYKNAVIVAPTGIAAINAGGVTIHSMFQVPFGAFVPSTEISFDQNSRITSFSSLIKQHKISPVRKNVLQALELLVIDEVSMLRADLLDAIDVILRNIRNKPNLSFGGVQLLLIGDLLQLPPVIKDNEWNELKKYYKSVYFFDALAFSENNNKPMYLELDKIYRQSDADFIRVLNNLRTNSITNEDIELLNSHYKPDYKPKEKDKFIFLSTHNFQADKINKDSLDKIKSKAYYFDAEISGDFPESMYPVDVSMEIKVGAQIMFVKNDSETPKRFYNGKIAKVSSIDKDQIEVIFEDGGDALFLEKFTWENKSYRLNSSSNEIEESIIGSFKQFPIKLAWAITVHKSQGLTFEKAILDLGNAFAPGQVYVALSRLVSLKGLVLTTKINFGKLANDQKVIDYAENKIQSSNLSQILEEEQFKYLQEFLLDCYNFDSIYELLKIEENLFTKEESKNKKNNRIEFLKSVFEKFEELNSTAKKFINWIQFNFYNNAELVDKLIQKVEGAKDFFEPKLRELTKTLLAKINQLENNKKNKPFKEELFVIEVSIYKKVLAVQKSKILINSAFGKLSSANIKQEWNNEKKHSIETFDDSEKDILNEIHLPKTKEKKEKIDTKLVSFEFYKQGKSIQEIANERGLVNSTIENHLSYYVGLGLLPLNEFVDKIIAEKILDLLSKNNQISAAEIIEYLNGEVNYSQIKFVRAFFQNSNKEGIVK